MTDFEKKHPGIAQQELWKLFVRKAEEAELGRYFISAVGEVCAIGLNLSKYIVRFFPTFTSTMRRIVSMYASGCGSCWGKRDERS